MNDDETKAKLKKIMEDGFGYPFHDNNSVELTSLNRFFSEAMDGVIDNLRDEMCGNCEFSCNESNCDKRHNN